MKKITLLLIALLPILCFAQKIESKIDDFTGEKVITTSWEKIYSGGMTGNNQTRISLGFSLIVSHHVIRIRKY